MSKEFQMIQYQDILEYLGFEIRLSFGVWHLEIYGGL